MQWQSVSSSSGSKQRQGNGIANYNPVYQRSNNPFSERSTSGSTDASISKQRSQAQISTLAASAKQSSGNSGTGDSFKGLVDFGMPRKADSRTLTLAQQAGK